MRYVWYLIGLAVWIVIVLAAVNCVYHRFDITSLWVIYPVAILVSVVYRPAVRFLYQCSKGLGQ